jgi:hypothetical protein
VNLIVDSYDSENSRPLIFPGPARSATPHDLADVVVSARNNPDEIVSSIKATPDALRRGSDVVVLADPLTYTVAKEKDEYEARMQNREIIVAAQQQFSDSKRAFVELLINGGDTQKRAAHAKGEDLTTYVPEVSLKYKHSKDGSLTSVTISDDGEGMDVDALTQNLLQPKQRQEDSAAKVVGKFGQGFFSVLGLLQKEDDSVTVVSRRNGIESVVIIRPTIENNEVVGYKVIPYDHSDKPTRQKDGSDFIVKSSQFETPNYKESLDTYLKDTLQYKTDCKVKVEDGDKTEFIEPPKVAYTVDAPTSGEEKITLQKLEEVENPEKEFKRPKGIITIQGVKISEIELDLPGLEGTYVLDLPLSTNLPKDRSRVQVDFLVKNAFSAIAEKVKDESTFTNRKIEKINVLYAFAEQLNKHAIDAKKINSPLEAVKDSAYKIVEEVTGNYDSVMPLSDEGNKALSSKGILLLHPKIIGSDVDLPYQARRIEMTSGNCFSMSLPDAPPIIILPNQTIILNTESIQTDLLTVDPVYARTISETIRIAAHSVPNEIGEKLKFTSFRIQGKTLDEMESEQKRQRELEVKQAESNGVQIDSTYDENYEYPYDYHSQLPYDESIPVAWGMGPGFESSDSGIAVEKQELDKELFEKTTEEIFLKIDSRIYYDAEQQEAIREDVRNTIQLAFDLFYNKNQNYFVAAPADAQKVFFDEVLPAVFLGQDPGALYSSVNYIGNEAKTLRNDLNELRQHFISGYFKPVLDMDYVVFSEYKKAGLLDSYPKNQVDYFTNHIYVLRGDSAYTVALNTRLSLALGGLSEEEGAEKIFNTLLKEYKIEDPEKDEDNQTFHNALYRLSPILSHNLHLSDEVFNRYVSLLVRYDKDPEYQPSASGSLLNISFTDAQMSKILDHIETLDSEYSRELTDVFFLSLKSNFDSSEFDYEYPAINHNSRNVDEMVDKFITFSKYAQKASPQVLELVREYLRHHDRDASISKVFDRELLIHNLDGEITEDVDVAQHYLEILHYTLSGKLPEIKGTDEHFKTNNFQKGPPLSSILASIGNQSVTSLDDLGNKIVQAVQEGKYEGTKDVKRLQRRILSSASYQSPERHVAIRECIQNSLNAIAVSDVENKSVEITTFQEEDDVEHIILSMKDHVGMDMNTFFNRYLKPQASGWDEQGDKGVRGFFGQGAYTLFRDSESVRIKTSTGNGKTIYAVLSPIRDEKGNVTEISLDRFDYTDEDYKGTDIQMVIPSQDRATIIPSLQAAAKEYADLIPPSDGTITFDGTIVNNGETAISKSEHFTFYEGKGASKVASRGLKVGRLDIFEKQIPPFILNQFRKAGLAIDIDSSIKLIDSRDDIAQKDTVMTKLQPELQLQSLKILQKLYLDGKVNSEELPYDFFDSFDQYSRSFPGNLSEISAQVQRGEYVDISKYNETDILILASTLKTVEIDDEIIEPTEIIKRIREDKSFINKIPLNIRYQFNGVFDRAWNDELFGRLSFATEANPAAGFKLLSSEIPNDEENSTYNAFNSTLQILQGASFGSEVSSRLARTKHAYVALRANALAFVERGNPTVYWNLEHWQQELDSLKKVISSEAPDKLKSREAAAFFGKLFDTDTHEKAHIWEDENETQVTHNREFYKRQRRIMEHALSRGLDPSRLLEQLAQQYQTLSLKDNPIDYLVKTQTVAA